MAIWSRVAAFITGGAVTTAAADGVRPVLEPVRQHAWSKNRQRALDVDTTARLVAQAIISMGEASDEAGRNGYNLNRLEALVKLTQTMPGQADLDKMLNRTTISLDLFNEALAKHQVDPRFWEALYDLTNDKLSPDDLARGIHRGLVPDPGLLEGEMPSGVGNVPAYPVYDIDAIKEAAAGGFDRKRLGVLVGLQGNPMGAHEAAQAMFRKILTRDDYLRAVAESNTRNEWADAIFEQSRQIPTAREFLENALRGYRTLEEALAGAARHGMSAADATMVYQNQGRPMAVRQITQALARGGKFKPEPGEITDPYMASIVEGNLKPAYYDLAFANRYTLPSPFVLRSLMQAGDLSGPEGRQLLLDIGWPPALAEKVSTRWAGGQAAKTDPLTRSARTSFVSALRGSYVRGDTDETQVRQLLTDEGIDQATQDSLVSTWNRERQITRKELTPTQLKKALRGGEANPATGAPFTREEVVAELVRMGYTSADANVLLDLS